MTCGQPRQKYGSAPSAEAVDENRRAMFRSFRVRNKKGAECSHTRRHLIWYLLFSYFGQPTFFRSASDRSAAFLAAGGRANPLGTSQISTRRFLASFASTSLPLR